MVELVGDIFTYVDCLANLETVIFSIVYLWTFIIYAIKICCTTQVGFGHSSLYFPSITHYDAIIITTDTMVSTR